MSAHRQPAFDELREAVRGVMPYLLTSNDGPEATPAINMPSGAGLRMAADRIEQRDAAIYRLRKAMADA